jgi:hypothetical protein
MSTYNEQLDQLSIMQDGWLDGECDKPSEEAIRHCRDVMDCIQPALGASKTYIYPRMDGGIQVEWDVDAWALSMHFMNDGEDSILAFGLMSERELESRIDSEQDVISFLRDLPS